MNDNISKYEGYERLLILVRPHAHQIMFFEDREDGFLIWEVHVRGTLITHESMIIRPDFKKQVDRLIKVGYKIV
jgi:hypothetical protein